MCPAFWTVANIWACGSSNLLHTFFPEGVLVILCPFLGCILPLHLTHNPLWSRIWETGLLVLPGTCITFINLILVILPWNSLWHQCPFTYAINSAFPNVEVVLILYSDSQKVFWLCRHAQWQQNCIHMSSGSHLMPKTGWCRNFFDPSIILTFFSS